MTFNMMGPSKHDYLKSYESAVAQLQASPNDRELQHQAVLALARMGSLDFALAEYERYGLSNVRRHEDIMALRGRLSKDLYLTSSGKEATEHALSAAQEYEAAYKDTEGYYSGINSATMAFLADMPKEVVRDRAQKIQSILPPTENLTPIDYYFIEATRAECLLLLGEPQKAKETLQIAIQHDPLNFTAHATTLKQFRMILDKLGRSTEGLSEFIPPRSIHYAGHIFACDDKASQSSTQLTENEVSALSISIADAIQKEDIGFGFGALAAGSDILIAEILLREGAELHLIFPTDIETFICHSVRPFGEAWEQRFQACQKKASSITILTTSKKWPNANLNRFSGKVAMGQAILRAKSLHAPTGQLIVWQEKAINSNTALHAKDWKKTGHTQIILPMPAYKALPLKEAPIATKPHSFLLGKAADASTLEFESSELLAVAILKAMGQDNLGLGIHIKLPNEAPDITLPALLSKCHKGQILISEAAASLLAFSNENRFQITYAGRIQISNDETIRTYSLKLSS